MQGNNENDGIPMEAFQLALLTSGNMTPIQQKRYIDKHWIILSDGNHALLSNGTIEMYDNATAKSLYFGRLPKELQTYYFKEKVDIRKVICNPTKPRLTETTLNLCNQMMTTRKPFAEYPDELKNCVYKMNDFLLKVLCKRNKQIFDHLIKMCAKMARCEKNDACIYLKGPQGCGKSTFPEFLRRFVMGEDIALETGSQPLKNAFNKELEGRIMVIFEELENFTVNEWIGISSTLKRWITSNTMRIERKGKDSYNVENLVTFWLLSNNDAIQDDDGRRYFILPVSTEHLQDHDYFEELRKKCFNREVGDAYYNYLMEINLEGFYSQNYPLTQSKLDSVAKRLDNVYKFLKYKYILPKKNIDKVSVSNLFSQYVEYCSKNQLKPKHKVDFNKTLEDVGITRKKDNAIKFYRITYEELNKISEKFHWVHDLDEVEEVEEDDNSMFESVIDKSVTIRAEDHKREIDQLKAEHQKEIANMRISKLEKIEKQFNDICNKLDKYFESRQIKQMDTLDILNS